MRKGHTAKDSGARYGKLPPPGGSLPTRCARLCGMPDISITDFEGAPMPGEFYETKAETFLFAVLEITKTCFFFRTSRAPFLVRTCAHAMWFPPEQNSLDCPNLALVGHTFLGRRSSSDFHRDSPDQSVSGHSQARGVHCVRLDITPCDRLDQSWPGVCRQNTD